jgi:DnaK suppressor protein
MPDKKMEKKQLELFKKSLLKIKEDIVHDIKNMNSVNSVDNKDVMGDISGHALHMADVATDMYDREFTLGLASNDREILNKIEDALKRLGDKSFGLCIRCKKPITLARLKAIPYVETCLKCQEQLEKKS